MRQRLANIRSSTCDVAIMFLRIFIGGVMLLHIIGKLQDYDNDIIGFQSILGFDSATSFAFTVIIEGLFAAMIIIGVGTRLAALLMMVVSVAALGEAFIAGNITSPAAKLEFIYMGIYLTLTISGGGKYALCRVLLPDRSVPNS